MAEQSGFFDSIGHDRVYASGWLASYVAAIISNGVYNLELAVIANDNMSVKVQEGRAWINGYFYKNIGDYNLNIEIADGVLNRKDIVVLRFDINQRSINLAVMKGEYASTAVAPSLTRNAEVYELELCEISIPAGTTKITQSLITDKRLDKNLCGIVHGVVDQIDTTTLLKQMEDWFARFQESARGDLNDLEAEFDTWFQTIQGKLSEDIAGSLQLQIDTKVSKSEWEESRKAILTEGTGEAYTATVPWIKELTPGAEFIMIPHVASDSTAPTLNVNGLGAKQIRRRRSATSGGFVFGYDNGWLTANAPIRLIYSGLYWITDLTKPESFDISGIMSIKQGGTGANNASSACTNLGAVKKSGDTMTGILYAQSNTSYTTAQVRNIQVSTSDLTAGTSTLASGNLYFVYE